MEFLTRLFVTNLFSLFFAHLSLLLLFFAHLSLLLCFLPTFIYCHCFLPNFLCCYCFFLPTFCDNPVFAHHIVVIVFCKLFFLPTFLCCYCLHSSRRSPPPPWWCRWRCSAVAWFSPSCCPGGTLSTWTWWPAITWPASPCPALPVHG